MCQFAIMVCTYFVDLRRIYLHNNKQFEEWVTSKTKQSWIDSISRVIAFALSSSETKQKVASHREVYTEANEDVYGAFDDPKSPLLNSLLNDIHIPSPPLHSFAENDDDDIAVEIEIAQMNFTDKDIQDLCSFESQFAGDSLP